MFLSCCCVVAKFCPTLAIPYNCMQPTRLLCPWDFPGKNIGLGCHFLLQGIFDPEIELMSPTRAGGFFTTEPLGKPLFLNNYAKELETSEQIKSEYFQRKSEFLFHDWFCLAHGVSLLFYSSHFLSPKQFTNLQLLFSYHKQGVQSAADLNLRCISKASTVQVTTVFQSIQFSSVVPFLSCLQSFPASGSFSVSQFFASGGQRVGVSASASVLPMNIQD